MRVKSQKRREAVASRSVGGMESRTCDGEVCTALVTKVLHFTGSRPACAHNSRVENSGMFDERARAVAEGPAAPTEGCAQVRWVFHLHPEFCTLHMLRT